MSTVEESNNTQGEEQALLPNADNANDASASAVEANNQGVEEVEPTNQQRAIISSSENSVASNNTTSIHSAIATSASEEPAAVESEAKTTPHNEANAIMLHMAAPPHYPVAEFLFQLTKMLTDDNKGFIEWKNASIFVHDPPVSLLLMMVYAERVHRLVCSC